MADTCVLHLHMRDLNTANEERCSESKFVQIATELRENGSGSTVEQTSMTVSVSYEPPEGTIVFQASTIHRDGTASTLLCFQHHNVRIPDTRTGAIGKR